jgi:sucrose-phosphate synthase
MLIETKNLPQPTFIVADAGTHIYDGPEWLLDIRWHQRMSHRWSPSRVRAVAGFFPMLVRQPPEFQAAFKCSYYLDEAISAATLSTLQDALHIHRVAARMVYSGGRHLDLLPLGGGKDAAVRFLAERLQLPLDRVVTANVPHDGLL